MFERIAGQAGKDNAGISGHKTPEAAPGAAPGAAAEALPVRSSSQFEASDKPGTSIIGTDLTILGEGITIISKNNLRVDGDVRGNVAGREVVIGPEGSVTGTVSAERIEVFGGVRGAICSVDVALHASAQVDGEIVHETMTMEQGAFFEGKVRRLTNRQDVTARLDPAFYDAPQQPAAAAE